MTRLAFGAKCGGWSVEPFRSDVRAREPRNCRRLIMGGLLLFRDRFVEVEDRACYDGPGRQFRLLQLRVRFRHADGEQLLSLLRLCGVGVALVREKMPENR